MFNKKKIEGKKDGGMKKFQLSVNTVSALSFYEGEARARQIEYEAFIAKSIQAQKNALKELGINDTEYFVDWGSIYVDGMIKVVKKPIVKTQSVKEEDAKPELQEKSN